MAPTATGANEPTFRDFIGLGKILIQLYFMDHLNSERESLDAVMAMLPEYKATSEVASTSSLLPPQRWPLQHHSGHLRDFAQLSALLPLF